MTYDGLQPARPHWHPEIRSTFQLSACKMAQGGSQSHEPHDAQHAPQKGPRAGTAPLRLHGQAVPRRDLQVGSARRAPRPRTQAGRPLRGRRLASHRHAAGGAGLPDFKFNKLERRKRQLTHDPEHVRAPAGRDSESLQLRKASRNGSSPLTHTSSLNPIACMC